MVLCVASSGIAPLLLPGGRTAHSRFHIPLAVTDTSICNIAGGTYLAKLIKQTSLIIWDKVPMQHKYCFEAVNRTLNEICEIADSAGYFGNIPIVLGGDFAQILPVVPKGNRAGMVTVSVQNSHSWSQFQVLSLTTNMGV